MVIQDDLGDDAALLHYYSASYVSLMFIKTDCLHWTYSKGNKKICLLFIQNSFVSCRYLGTNVQSQISAKHAST